MNPRWPGCHNRYHAQIRPFESRKNCQEKVNSGQKVRNFQSCASISNSKWLAGPFVTLIVQWVVAASEYFAGTIGFGGIPPVKALTTSLCSPVIAPSAPFVIRLKLPSASRGDSADGPPRLGIARTKALS